MSGQARLAAAAALVVVGAGAVVLLGPPISQCLGPLGVTAIQCARATGWYPSVGLGLPIFVACIVLAGLVANPALRRQAAFAGLGLGAVAASAIYLAIRPTIWTGPTSTGEVISLSLPLDGTALAYVALLGAVAGLAIGWFAMRWRRA
jgi:hypothetical protein